MLGNFLRHARKRAKVSQVKLSQMLDQPQSFVSKFERGDRRLEMMEFVLITRLLGLDPVEALREFLTSDPEAFQRD